MTNNKCPYCGATLQKTQGYNFVCEYCGKTTPVDAQTRAAIDATRNAKQRQIAMAQQRAINDRVQKKTKKGCWIAIIIAICAISIPSGISIYSSYKKKRDKAEEQEKIEKVQQDILSSNPNSIYVAPSDIFITNNKERIGHLNQDLITTLKQKGYVEDGALTYSYYVNGKPKEKNSSVYNSTKPLITVEINSYKPITSYSERLNETDAVHSVAIIIANQDIKKAYENSFKKDLRNIGFGNKPNYDFRIKLKSSLEMNDFDLIRFGTQKTIIDTTFSSEYYTSTETHIIPNWEGVKCGERYSYENKIECVAFREF
jgi:uncharacterized Zn finger protein (UPF0148 family)